MQQDDLKNQVITSSREYGILSVLFRHAIGEKLGLSATDMECLGALYHKGLATPSELAAYTGLSSGAATAMLDRLERAGLIKRRPHPKDRRSVQITLVPGAAKKMSPLFASVRQAQDNILSGYNEQQLTLLQDFFGKMNTMWEVERKKLG